MNKELSAGLLLAVVSSLLSAGGSCGGKWGKSTSSKAGWKWFARQRINRGGLIWIKGHPVWGLISNQTFGVLSLLDTAMREVMGLDNHIEPEDIAKCRRSFSFLKAAALNLPYSTPRMIEIYNSYKREMLNNLVESLRDISTSTLKYLSDKKSLKSKAIHTRLSGIISGLSQQDYDGAKGTIMPIEHVRPEARQFLVIDVGHESLLSSDSDSFEISGNHSLWRLLPSQYKLLIGQIFTLSNQPTRTAEVTKDLCAIAFLLEALNGVTKSYYDVGADEMNIIAQAYNEVQIVLARLINTLVTDQTEKSKWLSVVEVCNSFSPINAMIEQESGV